MRDTVDDLLGGPELGLRSDLCVTVLYDLFGLPRLNTIPSLQSCMECINGHERRHTQEVKDGVSQRSCHRNRRDKWSHWWIATVPPETLPRVTLTAS